ncbi:hypothetical protein B1B04_21470 [Lysinibacillus sp. KCTC 33748]|uniref:hypothetical protein n=1 Tax=unclassified Lysinibacillus TaxID=2636778 RepID=UPI0009A85CA1|nr:MULTISPECIES: hypothetical protein [unclassified Lysinibacillus]OXS68341.1 hypothetical protein B1B04_21470 [Lysinibacillus sp. KCTC 33748]SKC12470.1 hypothetical protein SAMN06295926_12566 [Lysinibacillus sp. AC-3]
MAIITYVLIGLYALLTGIAGLQQWRENGYQIRTFLFIVLFICILVTIFLPNKALVLMLLILEFVLIHVLAVAEGLVTNKQLRYSHHVVRFIFHCILLLMVYKFIYE